MTITSQTSVDAAPPRPFVGPSRVTVAPGSSRASAAELTALGVTPGAGDVVVVADAALLDLGLVEQPVEGLRSAGYATNLRPGVAGEPTAVTVESLLPDEPQKPVAAVVAIGGGSAVDAAKLVALASSNPRFDLTSGLAPTAHLVLGPPVIAIPTTAGTGAEATAVAMLWHDHGKRMFVHPFLVPKVALLDPTLVTGLPASVTAASGLDAISHAVESLLSTWRGPLSERAALSSLARLSVSLPRAYSDGADLHARQETLLGAFEAGLSLNASVVLGHSLAYVIAERASLPHGVSCAMTLPYCVAHVRPVREPAIAEIAAVLCEDEDAGGRELIEWLAARNAEMGIPSSLREVGIDADDLSSMAAECIGSYPRPNHPLAIEVEDVEALLARLLDGDPVGAWQAVETRA